MPARRVSDLLDRIGCLKHPCDLDLLLFFYRHPLSVLTSERLAVYVGYEVARVAQSLDVLIAAELLARVQRPTGSARIYLLTQSGRTKGWLDALLRLASTRTGRLAVIAALARREQGAGPSSATRHRPRAAGAHVRDAPDLQRVEVRYA